MRAISMRPDAARRYRGAGRADSGASGARTMMYLRYEVGIYKVLSLEVMTCIFNNPILPSFWDEITPYLGVYLSSIH